MKFNEFFRSPILINLDRRADRLEQFDKQAQELEITYTRLAGIPSVDPITGCTLSHIAALTMCRDQRAFIFEDDAVFVDGFQEQFETAMSHLPDDWDMVYLGAHLLQKEPVNDYWVRSLECSSTHAYAVRAEVIPRLIDRAKLLDVHIDVAYSKLHKDLKVYAARPTLVYQGASYSDLIGGEVDYKYLYF